MKYSSLAGLRSLMLFLLITGIISVTASAQDASTDTTEGEPEQTEMSEEQENEEESRSFLQKIFPSLGSVDGSAADDEERGNPYADYTLEELNEELLEQAKKQNIEEMIKIIEEGGRINTENDHGRNALMEAARLGHIEVVKTLIKYGATLNAKDDYDGTALEYAEKEGHIDIVHILQKNGARR